MGSCSAGFFQPESVVVLVLFSSVFSFMLKGEMALQRRLMAMDQRRMARTTQTWLTLRIKSSWAV